MFKVKILSKEKMVFEREVTSLIVPGIIGYFEVLTNHAPIITALQVGVLTVRWGDQKKIFAISGGAVEFSNNCAVVLGDAIEAPEEIDVKRAEEAQYKLSKLIENTVSEVEREVIRKMLLRVNNRLKVANEGANLE